MHAGVCRLHQRSTCCCKYPQQYCSVQCQGITVLASSEAQNCAVLHVADLSVLLLQISPEFEEVQRRVRNSGRTDRAAFDAVERLLERHFKVGQPVRPRVVKYKKDRGMSVVDLTLLNTVDEPKGVDAVNFGLPETAADGAAKAAAAAAAADAPSAAPTAEGADSKPGSNSGAHPAVNGQEGAQEGSNTGTNTRIEAGSGNGSGNGKSPDSAPPKERTGGSGANGGTGQSGAGHGSALTRPRTIDKKEGKMEGVHCQWAFFR